MARHPRPPRLAADGSGVPRRRRRRRESRKSFSSKHRPPRRRRQCPLVVGVVFGTQFNVELVCGSCSCSTRSRFGASRPAVRHRQRLLCLRPARLARCGDPSLSTLLLVGLVFSVVTHAMMGARPPRRARCNGRGLLAVDRACPPPDRHLADPQHVWPGPRARSPSACSRSLTAAGSTASPAPPTPPCNATIPVTFIVAGHRRRCSVWSSACG